MTDEFNDIKNYNVKNLITQLNSKTETNKITNYQFLKKYINFILNF